MCSAVRVAACRQDLLLCVVLECCSLQAGPAVVCSAVRVAACRQDLLLCVVQ